MIVSTGELIVDCFKEGGGYFRCAGGAPFNAASGAALLGGDVAFYGAVGDDDNGSFMAKEAAKIPFKSTVIEAVKGKSTTYSEVIIEGGERQFLFHRENGADYHLSFASLMPLLGKDTSLVHLGSLMLPFAEGQRFLSDVFDYKRRHPSVRVSFDVNYRPGIFPSGEEGRRLFLPVIEQADIVKVTEEELKFLTGYDDVVRGARALSHPDMLLCVSMGKAGSFFHFDEMEGFVPPSKVLTPVDTTGAGDSFFSYVLFALDNQDLRSFRQSDYFDIFERANACGALATQKKGALASFPSLDEVERFIVRD